MADVYADLDQFKSLGLPGVALDGFVGDPMDHVAAASSFVDLSLRGR